MILIKYVQQRLLKVQFLLTLKKSILLISIFLSVNTCGAFEEEFYKTGVRGIKSNTNLKALKENPHHLILEEPLAFKRTDFTRLAILTEIQGIHTKRKVMPQGLAETLFKTIYKNRGSSTLRYFSTYNDFEEWLEKITLGEKS